LMVAVVEAAKPLVYFEGIFKFARPIGLQHIATHCNALQCSSSCNTLHTLRRTTTHFNVVAPVPFAHYLWFLFEHRENALQHKHCIARHRTASHCNALQLLPRITLGFWLRIVKMPAAEMTAPGMTLPTRKRSSVSVMCRGISPVNTSQHSQHPDDDDCFIITFGEIMQSLRLELSRLSGTSLIP